MLTMVTVLMVGVLVGLDVSRWLWRAAGGICVASSNELNKMNNEDGFVCTPRAAIHQSISLLANPPIILPPWVSPHSTSISLFYSVSLSSVHPSIFLFIFVCLSHHTESELSVTVVLA